MIIIGTAGHIDHGKSSIVKRLTGTDPDRLPEEKARGMTIDLGFAFRNTPSGDSIAFVDVPGHERFVKNMIAGAGGIDVVMLVVAADDGWMPQSEEHFQVVRLLGVTQGVIVLNKIDLVEQDWLELLEQEIHEKVTGSFLADAPIFKVSAQTGEGFDKLGNYLDSLIGTVSVRKDIGKPRLYIDRSFIRQGIGGIVTGTLRGGSLQVSQPVTVWPAQVTGKIRSLQSNGRDVQTAVPGQRTAISLTGVDKELLIRGGVITDRNDLSFFEDNPVLALSIELLNNSPVSLANRRRVLLIIGTTEIEGEIRLYGQKQINPSEKGIIFFKPDIQVLSYVGDHYIMRLPTPMVTLGGGQVLDHLPHFPRQRYLEKYRYLQERTSGQLSALILSEINKQVVIKQDNLLQNTDYAAAEIKKVVHDLLKSNKITRFESYLYHPERMEQAVAEIQKNIRTFLEDKSHFLGISQEQVQQLSPYDSGRTTVIIRYMLDNGSLITVGDNYTIPGRGMSLKGEVKTAYNKILNELKQEPFTPPTLKVLTSGGKPYRDAIKFILDSGQGYKCGGSFVFLRETWQEIIRFIKKHLSHSDSMAVADLREQFGMTRKFAIPVLEEMDRIRLTQRDGDVRVKGARFDDEEFNL